MDTKAKIVLLICDGLGDRPIPELGNLTPLEKAQTPNLDRLAKEGIAGQISTLGPGIVPGSDVAHLTLFGYDINKHYSGRGPIEVAGLGMKLSTGDIALRGNMGTVENGIIVDRRAGRITDVTEYAKVLDGIEIDGVTFIVKPGTAHRVGVIMRGENLSAEISDADPHVPDVSPDPVRPLDDSQEAKFTADVLNKFIVKAHEILEDHEANKARKAENKLPANYVLLRGAGMVKHVPDFEDRYGLKPCAIAGAGLYKGVAAYVGMTVIEAEGATGLPNTNVESKFSKLLEVINDYDFAFVHVKAADSLGEDGNFQGKTDFIEKIDKAAKLLFDLPENTILAITGDHSTPSALRFHSADPVPMLLWGPGVRTDFIEAFGERACARGGFGLVQGINLLGELLNLAGLGKFIGA